MTQTAAPQIGTTAWRLIAMPEGSGSCDHCGRTLKHLYRVASPDGDLLTVGRGCVKKLTGWTLAASQAERMIKTARAQELREIHWQEFRVEHPAESAIIDADIAAFERTASRSAGAGASHEVKWQLSESGRWDAQMVARYMRRRSEFHWVR